MHFLDSLRQLDLQTEAAIQPDMRALVPDHGLSFRLPAGPANSVDACVFPSWVRTSALRLLTKVGAEIGRFGLRSRFVRGLVGKLRAWCPPHGDQPRRHLNSEHL